MKSSFLGFLVFIAFISFNGDLLAQTREAGITENLGAAIPEGILLSDETGKKADISSLISRPTILSFAYFSCTNLCVDVLSNTAATLKRVKAVPGKDYSVLTVSFDEDDTPQKAAKKKKEFLISDSAGFPEGSWRFMTGDAVEVGRLASAIGFNFQRQGDGFQHPAALVVLSAKGKIIRYLYGTKNLPRDVEMALIEASEDRTGPTIPKALLYCFRFDPEKKTYVLSILRFTGVSILFVAAGFLVYIARKQAKDRL